MSSSSKSTGSGPPLPAPWRADFLDHISKMGQAEFTLSTIRKVSQSHAVGGGIGFVPRARTCIFRGLWAELDPNKKNDAPLNPGVFGSDLPTFTTDVRMEKAGELFDPSDAEAYAAHEKLAWKGSGGGGPVEAVWWVEETSTQWRVRGRTYVLGPDVEESEEGKKVVKLLQERMRPKEESPSQAEGWSFAKEITAHFGNLGPSMRGSFRAPPPGTPRVENPDEENLSVGQKVTTLDDEIARRNFRVVVIVPYEIDQVDLATPQRFNYEFVGNGATAKKPGGEIVGQWEKVELWP